ncbi:ubiquinone biosynthesis protein UbiE [Carboxydothermus islandicus]|uniref:Ubiquinone biosynthesis protein UbiE n=1 Tax=Carboxydothermus islandicus TaxID=661089 RepID=A0A1L8CZR9_9THEO|nr:methyltransferase domain-containing protein [Carboxydothermus islandicus]GAV24436.1 ubiquinone biosynthesis protein UbiE [Carboxydothermus islandicus]
MIALLEKIIARYEKESGEGLSCGNNIAMGSLKPGMIVLDLGCGNGGETIRAAQIVAPGIAVGLDITEKLLEKGQKKAREQGVKNVVFIKGEIENLPFVGESFDVVISNCALNHARDKLKVYREIYRVLKEDGYFVVSDPVSLVELPPEIKNNEELWAQCFAGAEEESKYLRYIIDAGFTLEILKRREYEKNGYPFASLTIKGTKKRR